MAAPFKSNGAARLVFDCAPSGSSPRDALTPRGVAARRLADVAAECRAEGARRAVADAFGNLAHVEVVASQQILRDGHAPGEQILHRWQSDGSREAFEECRARQRSRPRELGHRPRPCELTVHLADRRRESRVGQPAQQPRRRVLTWRRPQRFDEQHFHEAGEHEVTTWPPLARFLADEAHQDGEPFDAAHVDERGQQRHQQRRIRRVEDTPTAEPPHVGAPTARPMAGFAKHL